MCRERLISATCLISLVLGGGCNPSSSRERAGGPGVLPDPAADTVLRVHWIGKRHLAVQGGAFYFNRVWDLPETKLLQARALDQLSAAPWRLFRGDESLNSAPIDALRPLLDNLVYEESYLEVRSRPDGPHSMALAIHLDDESSTGWHNNLTIVLQSLTGYPPTPGRGGLRGWTLSHKNVPAQFEFARAGNWTILGMSTDDRNAVMDGLIEHVQSFTDPFDSRNPHAWLRAHTKLEWLAGNSAISNHVRGGLPTLQLEVSGDGGHVLTEAELRFSKSLGRPLEDWNLPDDMIEEPLTSFVAIRGLQSVFSSLPGWSQLPLGDIPDQACAWTHPFNAFQVYLAAAVSDVEPRVTALSEHLVEKVNPWLSENGPEVNGQPCPLFYQLPDTTGVIWGRLPGLQPFARSVSSDGHAHLLTGLITPQPMGTGETLRTELREALDTGTNLVWLGWEDTPARLGGWRPVLQIGRTVTGHSPLPEESLASQWLTAMELRVGETLTTVTQAEPDVLRLNRKSTLGLNAAELHLLVDWLESPRFPLGLHTFQANAQQQAAQ